MPRRKYCYRPSNNSHNGILNTICKRIEKIECKCYENNIPCIIVHGGAGTFSDSTDIEKMTGCKKAAVNGYKALLNGKNSVDAVEAALWWLECDEFYNAGYGSVLNEIGIVRLTSRQRMLMHLWKTEMCKKV